MYLKIALIFCLFLVKTSLCAQGFEAKTTTKNLKKHIAYLASDALEGRSPNTAGANLAAQYLVAQFAEIGLSPQGDAVNSYLQNFQFSLKKSPHDTANIQKMLADSVQKGKAQNVVGYLNNQAKHTIIIGAHYDHLGYGNAGSLFTPKNNEPPQIHNGADDNASGTAALIEIARNIAQNPTPYRNYNYLFIAFSGEEMGLYGSKFFSNNPTIPLSSVNCMLNMDMIGRLNKENVLIVNGVGTSTDWAAVMDTAAWQKKLRFKTTSSGIGPSDHTSFYLKDIPVLHFFTGIHTQYHKPTDDIKYINYKGEATIINYMLALIQKLNDQTKINFSKTKEEASQDTPRFMVTMGILPDYTYEGEGLKIDGVTDGKPAEKAGLKANDIIVALGSTPINDMMAYMKALSTQTKGVATTVTILRNKTKMVLPLTF